jgi:MFS family permease
MLPLLLSAVTVSFFANIASVNLPMFAEVHFGAAFGFILLSGLAILGSLLGTLLFGAVGEKIKFGKIFVLLFIFSGVVRILFVGAIGLHIILGILIFILYEGVTDTMGMFYYTATQKLPQKNLIGRVSTSFTSLRAAANAVGSIAGGVLGTLLANVDMAFIIQGISYVAIGVFLLLSKRIRGLPKVSEFKSAGHE